MGSALADAAVCAEEMLHLMACQNSLSTYAHEVYPDFDEAPHHSLIIERLEAVERGDCKRLMIFMPPRHGKSVLVDQIFACWMLGRHPRMRIIQTGYSAKLALEQSRFARDIFNSDKHRRVFPHPVYHPSKAMLARMALTPERKAAEEWGTIQRGTYYATGITGTIVGKGADLFLVDDPLSGIEAAEAEGQRNKVWDGWQGSIRTRLNSPDTAIIVVQTRWHPDDLAGRLLTEMGNGGTQWDVIECPAISDDGKALWPNRWPLEALEETRRDVGSYTWDAQYQQRPTLRGGNMFQVDNIKYHKRLADGTVEDWPTDARYHRAWDLASTIKERAKTDPDYTVGAKVAVTKDDDGASHLWIKNVVAMQEEAPRRNHIIMQTADADGAEVPIHVESVAGFKDTWATLKNLLAGKRMVHKVNVSGDKVVRASVLEPLFEAGNVHLVTDQPWTPLAIQHFTEFPRGAHDDVVDAVALGFVAAAKAAGYKTKLDRGMLGF